MTQTCARCGKVEIERKRRRIYCASCSVEANKEATLKRRNEQNAANRKEHNVCALCGKKFDYHPTAKYCSKECRQYIHNTKSNEYYHKTMGIERKPLVTKHTTPTKPVGRDAEQKRINQEIDARFNWPCEAKVYTRGTPEFMRVANEIMRGYEA